MSPLWKKRNHRADAPDLGWLDGERFAAHAGATVRDDIVAPLTRLGIAVDPHVLFPKAK